MSQPPPLTIRPLRTHREFEACERIQKDIWGGTSASSEVLLVTQENGGLVLGALAGKRVVGFLYAFLGRRHGRLMHWSHMMGVDPRYRDRGLGFRMKIEHRRRAMELGLDLIAWTFDPLQSRNAALNLTRLGADVSEYIPNCYGQFPSAIERGLPTDRFAVYWRIGSSRVKRRLTGGAPVSFPSTLPRVNETALDPQGLVANRRLHLALRNPRLLVEIPVNTDRMRAVDLDLARRWRLDTRRIFRAYFAAGYRLQDFLPPTPARDGRAFYLLARSASLRAASATAS